MAIYLIQPSEENFRLLKNDLEKGIFDNYYINLVDKCDESTLQSFFSELIQTNYYNRIYKIVVNPMGFFVYHPSVFTLNIQNPYSFLSSQKTKESEINSYLESVGNGIFNSLFTLKTIPIIKYRTGWFAENIVSVIQENFNNTFDKFPELKEEFPKRNNALLLILDRDTDLPIMLHHSASLGSMITDLFGITRAKSQGNKFEIDPLTDYIWNTCLTTNFVNAKEKIMEDLKNIASSTDFLDFTKNTPEDVEKVSAKLSSTLEGLRDISLKNTLLNNHAKFQDKLSKEIEERNLGSFYDIEEALLNSRRGLNNEQKKKFFDLIQLKSIKITDINVSKNDILRLCLMYYLINGKITNDEIKEIEKTLANYGQSMDSLEYLKQKKAFEDSMKKGSLNNQQDTGKGFLHKSFSFITDKFVSLVNSEQPSMVADIINTLANNKEEKNNFVSYNLLKKGLDKVNNTFNQVIVFIVGGGSLAEYEYIDELANKNGKHVSRIIFT